MQVITSQAIMRGDSASALLGDCPPGATGLLFEWILTLPGVQFGPASTRQ